MPARLLYRDVLGRDVAVDLPDSGGYLGRAADCLVRSAAADVPRHGCRIDKAEGGFWVTDLGCGSSTHLNDRCIEREVLRHGDVIRCGSLQVRFVEVAAPKLA